MINKIPSLYRLKEKRNSSKHVICMQIGHFNKNSKFNIRLERFIAGCVLHGRTGRGLKKKIENYANSLTMWKYENESSYYDPADREFRLPSPAAGSESAPYSNEPPQRSSSIYRIFSKCRLFRHHFAVNANMAKSNRPAISVTTCGHQK